MNRALKASATTLASLGLLVAAAPVLADAAQAEPYIASRGRLANVEFSAVDNTLFYNKVNTAPSLIQIHWYDSGDRFVRSAGKVCARTIYPPRGRGRVDCTNPSRAVRWVIVSVTDTKGVKRTTRLRPR